MKMLKKIATTLLIACMIVTCVPVVVQAADGRIKFSDPKTEAGVDFKVTIEAKSASGSAVGSLKVSMSFDSSKIQFKSGNDVTADGDTLVYETTGDGSSDTVSTEVTFTALKQGTTKIEITGYEATLDDGGKWECSEGNSTITVEGGTEIEATQPETDANASASGESVTVAEANYTITSEFKDSEIPTGFSKAEYDYDGATYTGVKQDDSDVTLGYLLDSESKGAFFYLDSEKSEFAPFEQITISSSTSIILLQDDGSVKLPEEQYKETSVTFNEHTFPAWQDTYQAGYYVMYAISNTGEKGLYMYESSEGTYQKFVAPEEEKTPSGIVGKIMKFFEDHLDWAIMAAGLLLVLLLIFLIIMITLAVKLAHRNSELDDLYDEYGIDDDFEEKPKKKVQKADKKSKKKRMDDDDFDFGDDDDDTFDFITKTRNDKFDTDFIKLDGIIDDFEKPKKQPTRRPSTTTGQSSERTTRSTNRQDVGRKSSARPARDSRLSNERQTRRPATGERGTGGVIPSQSVHRTGGTTGSRSTNGHATGERTRRTATDRPVNSRPQRSSRPKAEKNDIDFIDL